jgi:PAS domain S-box-containing protein
MKRGSADALPRFVASSLESLVFGIWKKRAADTAPAPTPAIDAGQLIAAAGDAIVVCDAAGAITLWNPAAERLFGYTSSEAMGQTLDIIIPERLRKRHWDGHHAAMARGTTRYGNDLLKVPAITKDGKSLSIAFTIAILRSANGDITGVASIIRDETARFQEDRALRQQVSELTAKLAG